MPEDYSFFKPAWDSTQKDEKTLERLISRLIKAEDSLKKDNHTEDRCYVKNDMKTKPTQCVHCQRMYHKSEDCLFKPCTYCRRTNHKSENCFHKTRVRETQNKYALLVEECKQDEDYNIEEKGSFLTVDSGCTGHTINDNEYLIDQKQYNSNIKTTRKGNQQRHQNNKKREYNEDGINWQI